LVLQKNVYKTIGLKIRIEMRQLVQKNIKNVLFDLVHVNEALNIAKSYAMDGIIGADILKKR